MDLFLCIASYYATIIDDYEYNMIFNNLVKDTTKFIDNMMIYTKNKNNINHNNHNNNNGNKNNNKNNNNIDNNNNINIKNNNMIYIERI